MMRITILLGWFLIVISGGCASMGGGMVREAFREDVVEAKKLMEAGQFRQSVEELTLLLSMDPKNDEARFLRGVAYQSLEDFPGAVSDFEFLLKRKPSLAKAHYNLGMIFAYKLNEPGRALNHFDRFLSLEPRHPKAYAAAKVMCSLEGQAEDLSGDASTAALLAENVQADDPAERRRKLLEIARSGPGSPVPYYLIGDSYEREGRAEEAMKYYQEALQVRSTCGPCHEAIGRLLIARGKDKEGEIHLQKAGLFNPN